jgi:probable F420-dependent oxidoreductase
MKIGALVFMTDKSGNPGEIAREAERLGFESFFVAEHLMLPVNYTTYYPRSSDGKVPWYYASMLDPFVALGVAAQTTKTIKLGTAICLLPQRDVIATAKATATIDCLSGGRLIFGVGAGWFREEAEILGVNFKRRWKHLRESVEALRELWSKEVASYEGEFVRFPPVKLEPKPIQKLPPIILGAHDAERAPRRVARYADGWCPGGLAPDKARDKIAEVKSIASEFGRDSDKLEFSVLLAPRGDEPSLDALKRYAEAGVARVVVTATAVSSSGIDAVRAAAPVLERAAKV